MERVACGCILATIPARSDRVFQDCIFCFCAFTKKVIAYPNTNFKSVSDHLQTTQLLRFSTYADGDN